MRTLERFYSFIEKYQPECLKKILGIELYNAFLTEDSQRMADILNGVDYTSYNNVLRQWDGLVHGDISLIANYVYYYYQKANALQTTGTSTKASKAEAGNADSPIEKMVAAWQFFAEETRHLCSFLWNKQIGGVRVYPEFAYYTYNEVMYFARRGVVNKFGF